MNEEEREQQRLALAEKHKPAVDQAQSAITGLSNYGFIVVDLTDGTFVDFIGGNKKGVWPVAKPNGHAPGNGNPAGSWNYEASPGCGWVWHYGKWYWVCT